jgi:2-polyprenyl-3-methyl-5-hydroxy-6-metoxy-1,4-benzoquinol methylase
MEVLDYYKKKKVDSYHVFDYHYPITHLISQAAKMKVLDSMINKYIKSTHLDLGCGNGMEVKHWSKLYPNTHFYGMDIGEDLISSLKQQETTNLTFVQGDINVPIFETKTFDSITTIDVLEHLTSTKKHIEIIKSYLKPSGKVVIITPNKDYLMKRIFSGIVPKDKDGEFDEHINVVSSKELIGELKAQGFRIIEKWRQEIAPPHPRFDSMYQAWCILDWMFGFRHNLFLGYSMIIVAELV